MKLRLTVLALAAGLSLAVAVAADAKTFRYATGADLLGLDPHSNNEGPTNAMKGNLYEGLLHRRPDLSLNPSLATEWQQTAPDVWRFKLRQGVKYHLGQDFTADDVVFSFARQSQATSDMAYAVASIKEVRKIDSHTVELVTKGPDPVLLQNLPLFYIMSKSWVEQNNAGTVERGAGKTNYPNVNANGTGPFRVVERVPDTRTVLEPNAVWWGNATRETNITRAVFQPIGNAATRVAALLSGEMDLIYPLPLQDVDRIKAQGGVQVMQGPELRTIFLGFDQWRDESLDMPGSKKNPFKDVRVRKAFYQAIDINAIQRVVMRGASAPTASMVAPGIQGFVEDLNKRLPFDPDGAKKLLAEAGYPNGFPVTLDCPNDRYVNDEAICLAVVPMIKRIGIDIKLNAQTRSKHFNKISLTEGNVTSFYLLGWTPGSYDSLNALMNLMTLSNRGAGHGEYNSGRYNNARVNELTDLIKVEVDQVKRNAMIREAFKIHQDEVGHIPLHQQALAWGVRDSVAKAWQRPFDDVDLRFIVMK
ncbi:MAG: ABC transporter substrate-binding protein [Alphaproteobacteria bacterium]|nr:ABC transporter substrate-binding protein [Alphaproteobacteria bacterium]